MPGGRWKPSAEAALACIALAMPAVAAAAPPDAELVTVTDTSFAATWTTAEPSDTTVCVEGRGCERQEEATRFHHAEVGGLRPGTRYAYSLRSGGAAEPPSATNPGAFTTLVRPPGRHLFDFALLSDVHIGETCSGTAVTFPAPAGSVPPCYSSGQGEPPYSAAMAAAAVEELNVRGIGLAVLNADNTSHGEYDQVVGLREALGGFRGQWHVARGAHDRAGQNRDETRCGEDEDCFRTILFPERPPGRIYYGFDFAGHHFVALDSAKPGDGTGDLTDPAQRSFLERDLQEARQAGRRTFVFFHHPVSEYANTTSFPPVVFGVRPEQGRQEFLSLMGRFPNVVGVLNSHTHRNYVSYAPATGFRLPYLENAPTKEYPGGYTIFRVHEGGYMRNFHRLRCEFCRAWISRTREEYYGLYPQYTLGTLSARNFTHVYDCEAPTPPPSPPFGNVAAIGGDTFRPACREQGGGDEPGTQRAEPRGCRVARTLRVRRDGIGRFRTGDSRRRLRSLAGPPDRTGRRSLRWCVRGGGRVLVALSDRARVALIATTAPRHRARGVRRGSSLSRLRRAFPDARRVTRRLWAVPAKRLVFGVKRGRVRFVAVVDLRAARGRRTLERHLGRVRLQAS